MQWPWKDTETGNLGPGLDRCRNGIPVPSPMVLFLEHAFWQKRRVENNTHSSRLNNLYLPSATLIAQRTVGPSKQNTLNITLLRSQLTGGEPVGYLQALPRIWTRGYRENKSRKWSEQKSHQGLLEWESDAPTTRPRCLHAWILRDLFLIAIRIFRNFSGSERCLLDFKLQDCYWKPIAQC